MEKFIITKDYRKAVRRFNLQGRTLEFKIKPIPKDVEPVGWLKEAINQIILKGVEDLHPTDQVGFSFCSKDFSKGAGWIRFRPLREVTLDDLWNTISSVYQSNSSGLSTDTFCLGVTSVKMPVGKGRGRRYNNFEEECGMRRGIVRIENKDNLCLPRALVVAIASVTKDSEYRKVRRDIGKIQTERAHELMRCANVIIPEEGAGVPEVQQFQEYLENYKVVIYQYGNKGRDVIYTGVREGRCLNLLYHEGHYNVITSLTAAFCCNYYCEDCHIPYEKKNSHRCGGTCVGCLQSPACHKEQLKVKCDDCKRTFRGPECYENHKRLAGKDSVCERIRRCEQCFKTLKSGRQHICGEIFCKICNQHVPEGHLCYIQPDTTFPKLKDLLFIFYDLETRQEKTMEDGSLLHEPNLCVFKQCCDSCMNGNSKICLKCGIRLHILKSSPIERFTEFVMNQRKIFKQVVVIAHNGSGFDHNFILNYILTKTVLKPEIIMRGTKITMMLVGNVKFLDSLNYFPMALSKLPKAFGLDDNFKKGYFPHMFNIISNENYVGPLPAIEFYSPDTMSEDDRNIFLTWYEQHKNDEFNMCRDIVDYCISDVEILAAACLKFRQQLLDNTNVCPFTEACTIASACNKVYRWNFLPVNTIGIIPKNGYRWRDNQSKIAVQWLVWEEKQRSINIIHAAKQQEAVVNGAKVDGFCPETNQVFEFLGCYWHGCPQCYKYQRDQPLSDNPSETLDLRYESTVAKTERLRNFGSEVIEMWECGFRKQLKGEMKTFTENHPLLRNTPLDAREAFYGGRTGNMVEHYRCREGEKIKYVDVCSLYPWACKYGKFPVGHPSVYVGKECSNFDLRNTDGLIKCTILPPGNLQHPVLPQKMNNKLMFVLCRTCGEQMHTSDCAHNDEERALTGTWVIDEVLKAIDMGYELKYVQEIWSYKTQKFSNITKTKGLFTDMMNKFIKIKQQASGWPKHCRTLEEQQQYINQFLEREDIQMEFAEVLENPGLRSLAKLILNSFWGKFGQRENQPKTKIVNDPEEFFNIISNPSIDVNNVLAVNDDTLVVSYNHIDEAYDVLTTVNIAIAAYVTTQARLKLYSYLEQLGDRVLYYDTDSVIYISRPNEFDVPTGEFIGDMTDELESYGPMSYITDFVSGGPKNYAYKVWSTNENSEKIICKVKGISLNYETSRIINFDCIKQMILTQSDPIPIVSRNIRRTKEHEVVTREETKMYRPNSTKRRFFADGRSVPYGFKKIKN